MSRDLRAELDVVNEQLITPLTMTEYRALQNIPARAPRIANPNRTCPECGDKFVATHPRQVFCRISHGRSFHRAMRDRGQVLLPLAQVWRRSKHGSNAERAYALSQMCAMLDRFNAEDKAAGRSTVAVVKGKMAAGWMAVDLD